MKSKVNETTTNVKIQGPNEIQSRTGKCPEIEPMNFIKNLDVDFFERIS